jgi:hypothetical protein
MFLFDVVYSFSFFSQATDVGETRIFALTTGPAIGPGVFVTERINLLPINPPVTLLPYLTVLYEILSYSSILLG